MSTTNNRDTTPPERATPPGDQGAADGARPLGGAKTRTCVGCNERVEAGGDDAPLVRLVLSPDGIIAVDPGNGGFGRGAHVHATPGCIAAAATRGLLRAAKRSALTVLGAEGEGAPLDAVSLGAAIAAAMDRRIHGLLGSAARAQRVAVGSDAVTSASHRNEAELIVVACDAAAAADLSEVRHAVQEGRAIAWGTKERLGEIFRKRAPVGVVSIASAGLAAAVKEAANIADASRAAASSKIERRGSRRPSGAARGSTEVPTRADQRRARGRRGSVGQSGLWDKPARGERLSTLERGA